LFFSSNVVVVVDVEKFLKNLKIDGLNTVAYTTVTPTLVFTENMVRKSFHFILL